MSQAVSDRALLQGAGLRVTVPRLAVLDAVRAHPHTDTDGVLRAMADRPGTVSVQAVYDVLSALTAAGLVRRIQPAGSVARYEIRVDDNHHHLVCRACRSITDVSCAVSTAPCLTPADRHGFVVEEAEVTFWGLCSECAAARPADTSTTDTSTNDTLTADTHTSTEQPAVVPQP